ncbi:hypothetical protein P8917_09105 [Bacillus atrophaeus]|nr:hypothetical protein [Bacillus atrophaeus]MCY8499844.1 hypothetical protein [Bacillus atrophaeus]MCY8814999.1 hypothetical protein [Bacillus atrophaeus]MCY8823049.1 hypothetical protein [Bacillus atrophaeus]MCY8831235.1 hypothetical protein [Bacillus atrophaeus]MCY8834880.1 hypothetical protein [Bacillus atrophaeus]
MPEFKTLKEIVEQIKVCDFKCKAGPLVNNVAFQKLAELADVKLSD